MAKRAVVALEIGTVVEYSGGPEELLPRRGVVRYFSSDFRYVFLSREPGPVGVWDRRRIEDVRPVVVEAGDGG